MLTPNEIQKIRDNYVKAYNDYKEELRRIGLEVDRKLRENGFCADDSRPLVEIIIEMINKKKENDERYIQAERALQKAQKEFDSISSKF